MYFLMQRRFQIYRKLSLHFPLFPILFLHSPIPPFSHSPILPFTLLYFPVFPIKNRLISETVLLYLLAVTPLCLCALAPLPLCAPLLLLHLSIYTQRRMRHSPQSLLRNKLPCFAADTVGFIFDPYKCSLEMLDKFQLPLSQPAGLFF